MSLSRPRRPQGSSVRKHRCWTFVVKGVKRNGIVSGNNDARILAAFKSRYTAAKRLVITPTTGSGATKQHATNGGGRAHGKNKALSIEVQFTGPQPSEGPGLLLIDLLSGSSVEAHPVNLGRGRKKKSTASRRRASTDEAEAEVGVEAEPIAAVEDTTSGNVSGPDSSVCDTECDEGGAEKARTASDAATDDGAMSPICDPQTIVPILSGDIPCKKQEVMTPHPMDLAEAMDRASLAATTFGEKDVISQQFEDLWNNFDNPHALPSRDDCDPIAMRSDTSSPMDLFGTVNDDAPDDCGLVPWCLDSANSESNETDPMSEASQIFRTPWPLDCNFVEGGEPCGQSWARTISNPGHDRNEAHMSRNTGQIAEMVDSGMECITEGWSGGIGPDALTCNVNPEIDLLHRVFDFEGHPVSGDDQGTHLSRDAQCHLLLRGLKTTGHGDGSDVRMPSILAFFSVGSAHKASRMVNLTKVGEDGAIYAAVFCPSMNDMWQDIYAAHNIQEVEVDVAFKIRWEGKEFECTGHQLKVTYRRPLVYTARNKDPTSTVVCRRIPVTAHDSFTEACTGIQDEELDFFSSV